MMLCGGPSYAASSKAEDVLAALKLNQMEYFFADVLLRGRYPGYAFRYFDDKGIHVTFGEDDEEALKHTADFLTTIHKYAIKTLTIRI